MSVKRENNLFIRSLTTTGGAHIYGAFSACGRGILAPMSGLLPG